jgi:hypothetical protein
MGESASAKAGPGEKADTLIARRPAPNLAAETRLQRMHQSIGNRAIGRMVQARLIVGPADDPYEREADQVADEVMGLRAGVEHVGEHVAAPAELGAQRLGRPNAPPAQADAIDERALAHGGEPLPASLRAFFEPRFGRDFSHVRVHTGAMAEDYTEALNAYAFTYGHHIWLGRGQTVHRSHLLAHELAHVVQQTRPHTIPGQRHMVSEGIHQESHAPLIRRRDQSVPDGPDTSADLSASQTGGAVTAAGARTSVAAAIQQWRQLPGRDPLAMEGMHGATPRVQRQPKGEVTLGEPTINPADAEQQPVDKWVRLQVFAAGMDQAAQLLAQAKVTFDRSPNSTNVFVGLHPRFVKVYDQDGKALGGRISLKEVKGLRFSPGVYVEGSKGLVALTVSSDNTRFGAEGGQSIVGQRPFTEEEKAAMAEEAKKAKSEKREPKPAPPAVVNFKELVTDPEKLHSLVYSVSNPVPIYFVPTYTDDGAPKHIYASPIEGRGDGEPPNAPPWPVTMEGPKLVPVDSDPTYAAKIDWSANGNFSVTDQVISQVGNTIHYRWEICDITQYAKKQAAENAAAAKKDDPNAKPEKTLDERIEDFKKSKAGTGEDVTGTGGARREFQREFEDWWKDTKRAAKGSVAPGGTTIPAQLSNAEANRLALELAPVSLLTTAVGAVVRLLADLFAGPRQQQEVPLQTEGVFLIRVITTPGINEDREGKPVIRPPSVAARVTEVTQANVAVEEALDEPGAQIAELKAQIAIATGPDPDHPTNPSKVEYLKSLLADAEERFQGSPLVVLKKKLKEKEAELEEFQRKYKNLSDYSRKREVEMLKDQIDLYEGHEAKRTEGATDLAPQKRLNATLISEVTGEQYPLLLSAGPMAMDGNKYRWLVSDVTNREGDAYIDIGDTPSAALEAALTKFGGKAAYGRGRIGVRTEGLGLEPGAKPTIFVDSVPTDWALAEKRLDDLVNTLVLLGLFVASAGTAGAVVGAALAAARLIERWQAGHLYLDAQTISDALSVLGGLGAAGHAIGGLYVQKFEKVFAVAREGEVAEAQIARAAEALKTAQQLTKIAETANEAIGYAGLLWGNVSFLDQMISISQQEDSGAITHAAARRARADAIASAVQNNGLFIAGNVLKAKGKAPKDKPAEPGAEKPPAAADKPVEDVLAGEGDKPAQKAGEPVPIGERRATQDELRAALPPDLQKIFSVDPTLEGDHVEVRYEIDTATGLIGDITVHSSPDARPATVALHAETVRTMQKYQGFEGRVRKAISWLADLVGIDTLKPENKASFEAALEVRKLPKAIREQMDAMERLGPAAREAAQAQLDHLELQLEQNLRTLELGGAGEGSGLVAAKGLSKAKQKQYAELRAKLRALEPGTEAHKKVRREMYELIGGDLPYDSWVKVYESNVDRANKANAGVAAEHERLGWGKTEQTIDLGRGEVRRLDIADTNPKMRRGVEVKEYESGKIYATEDIVSEVERDAKLVRRGWDITWVLIDTEPSAPLLEMLLKAGIPVEIRTRKGGAQSQLVTRYTPQKGGAGGAALPRWPRPGRGGPGRPSAGGTAEGGHADIGNAVDAATAGTATGERSSAGPDELGGAPRRPEVDDPGLPGPQRLRPEPSLGANAEAARVAGLPPEVVDSGYVYTAHDLPDVVPETGFGGARAAREPPPLAVERGRGVAGRRPTAAPDLTDVQNSTVAADLRLIEDHLATLNSGLPPGPRWTIEDVRINRTQVAEGATGPIRASLHTRPDLQFTIRDPQGRTQRFLIEYDRSPPTRALGHARGILERDPTAIAILKIIGFD